MKKNYALFLKWIVTLGLLFSIGFIGCDNVTGENGEAGPSYYLPLTIERAGSQSPIIAKGDKAFFTVKVDGTDIPDPASVSWKVWGDTGNTPIPSTLSTGSGTYYGRNYWGTELTVDANEPSSILTIEASYRGWTRTKELEVGLPIKKVVLREGNVSNIGTSHISLYDWAGTAAVIGNGRDGNDAAEATTYLVYGKGNEQVRDLRNGEPVPPGVETYHLNDDIKVLPGEWVTFYEVSAAVNASATIISYGSDQGYVYARGTGGNKGALVPGNAITIYNNIRLPSTADLPELVGPIDSTIGNGVTTSMVGNITGGGPYNGPVLDATHTVTSAGVPYAKINSAGSKNLTGYTLSLYYEGDVLKEHKPDLQIPDAPGATTYQTGGYDLAAAPTGGQQVSAGDNVNNKVFETTKKTGYHRWVVKHNDSTVWAITTDAITGVPATTSRFGIYVNQNNVTVSPSPQRTNDQNILTITAAAGYPLDLNSGAINTDFKMTTGISPWFQWYIGKDRYVTTYPAPTGEKPTAVDILADISATLSGNVTINESVFALGSTTLADSGSGVPITAKWDKQFYATITGSNSASTGKNSTWDPDDPTSPFDGELTYSVSSDGIKFPALPGTTGPNYTQDGDYITIKWYEVDGSDWGNGIPPSHNTKYTTSGYPGSLIGTPLGMYGWSWDEASQYNGTNYVSIVDPRPEIITLIGTHTGTYGRTAGIIIKSKNTSGEVLFIDALGNQVPNQFIVGVVK